MQIVKWYTYPDAEVVDITKKDAKKRFKYFVEAIYGEDGPEAEARAGGELMSVLDSLPYYAMLIDEDHKILFANKVVEKALDVKPDEIMGEYCPKVVHGLDGPYPGCPLEESVEKGGVSVELEFFDEDAGMWYVSAIYPTEQLTKNGKKIFFHTTRDITERKKGEEALRESEERLRTIIETEPECVKIIAPDGTVLEMNPAGLAMIEAESSEQVVGKLIYDLVAPEYQDAFKELTERALRGETGTLEFKMIGLKGNSLWLESHVAPFRGAEGDITGVLGVTRDITERKRTEREILHLKDFNERVINGIADAISVIDVKDFKIVGVNRAFLDICGIKEEEVIGKTCHEITHHQKTPCKPPDDPCPIGELLETGKPITVEHVHLDKNNRETSVEVSAYPLSDGGEIKQIVHIAKDTTERKKAEMELNEAYEKLKNAHTDLKSLDKLKSDIIANVTHELRTPITIASGALELAGEEDDKESRNELLKLARDSLMHQSSVVKDLIDAASIVDSDKKLKSTAVNLTDIVAFVRMEIEPRAASRNIKIDVRVKESLPLVKVNYLQLNRVLRHLASNAVKFNKEGGKVVIEALEKDDLVEICVEDTGIGIPEDKFEKIFEPLYQIDASATRQHGGTGMGLSIVKEIVEAGGGKICVESQEGEGSKFCFTLLIAKSVFI